MPDVLDLSTLKKNDTEAPAYDGLDTEEREALQQMAEQHEPDAEQVRTAFLVVIEEDGQVTVRPDLDTKVVRGHLPTADEIYTSAAVIQKDIVTQQTAGMTVQMMHQAAMVAQEQMQSQALAQRLNLKK